MRKFFAYLIQLFRGKIRTRDIGIYVENFRQESMNNLQVIQAASDSAKEGATIFLDSNVYTIYDSIVLKDRQTLKGTGTIKRGEPTDYFLTEATTGKLVKLNTVEGLKIGDFIIAYNGPDIQQASMYKYIVGINGNEVELSGELGNWDANTHVLKSYNLIKVSAIEEINESATFNLEGITFDGNKDVTFRNAAYYIGGTMLLRSRGKSRFTNCKFINMPNENVVGHNIFFDRCRFYNLNGSAIHWSISADKHREVDIASIVTNCVTNNTNQISTKQSGHSEGVFTTSNSGGYFTLTSNTITNSNGASLIGSLYPSLHALDYGTNEINIHDNYIENVDRFFYAIDVNTKGEIEEVNVSNNKTVNMKEGNYGEALIKRKGVKVYENIIYDSKN